MNQSSIRRIKLGGWLAIAWGGLMLLSTLYGAWTLTSLQALSEVEAWRIQAGATMGLVALLWILSGVGLVVGAAWGWWSLGVQTALGLFRHSRALVYLLQSDHPVGPFPPWWIALRVLGFLAILLWWLSADLRQWCGVEHVGRASAALVVVAVTGAIVGGFTLWLWSAG